MMKSLDIYLAVPDEPGWAPIREMVQLLSYYTSGELIEVDVKKSLNKSTKLIANLPRFKFGKKQALVISYDPGQLYAISQMKFFTKIYGNISGWVIDSFWSDRIPKFVKNNNFYNNIFVTDFSDQRDFEMQGIQNVHTLLWGSRVWENKDLVLNFEKKNDLLRVGRQPKAWDDDKITASVAKSKGITFEGRPPFGKNSKESQKNLQNALLNSRYVLAFSNSVSPAKYTHPSKEYITARWTDALSYGCKVVGVKPKSEATKYLLWEGSTIEIDPFDINKGMDSIVQDLSNNSSREENYKNALSNLDWRFRFEELLNVLEIKSKILEMDLSDIREYLGFAG